MSKEHRLAKLQKLKSKKALLQERRSKLMKEISENEKEIGETFPLNHLDKFEHKGKQYFFSYANTLIGDSYSIFAYKTKTNGEPYADDCFVGRFTPSELGLE